MSPHRNATPRCRDCRAKIRLVRTKAGGWMPLHPEYVEAGNVVVCDDVETAAAYGTKLGRAVVLTRPEAIAARADGVDLYARHLCPRT